MVFYCQNSSHCEVRLKRNSVLWFANTEPEKLLAVWLANGNIMVA
jgi:hypothetical protein